MSKSFEELGLNEALLCAIAEQGYVSPMPVQEQVIPVLLSSSCDLVALAQTGTGKTAAYGLPLLQGIDPANRRTQAVVLSPTRELCLQIADDLEGYARYMDDVHVLPVYGGADIVPQMRSLRQGVQVIVATPGRLIDLMERGAVRTEAVTTIVLDEADEMLSMGFSESIEAIMSAMPAQHRTLLFSATMSREVERVAGRYLHHAQQIVVGSRNEGAEHVTHIYYMVQARATSAALKRLVDFYPKIYAIIFCRTRIETQQVADALIKDGYNADALHGDLSQQQRDLTMQKFRQHRTQLLVATDVAARGLDVDDLTHVINYGMPDDIENYTHRSGRTGRAGKKGTSLCIIHQRERSRVRDIERVIGKTFERGTLPTGKDICAKQLYKTIDDIERTEVDDTQIEPFMQQALRRLSWLDKEDIVRRVLQREFGRFLSYYADKDDIQVIAETHPKQNARSAAQPTRGKGKRRAEPGFVSFFLSLGRADGIRPRDVMAFINSYVHGRIEVGRIDIHDNFSFFEIPERDAHRIEPAFKHAHVKGRRIVVSAAQNHAMHN